MWSWAIGLSLTGCVLAGAAAAENVKVDDLLAATPGVRVCYARQYDAAHLRGHPQQRVAGITLAIRTFGFDNKGEWVLKADAPHKYTRALFAIRFARRGGKPAQLTQGECQNGEMTVGCFVECDGGGFHIQQDGKALLLHLAEDGIRIDDCDEKDVRLKPGTDDKVFRLEKVADAQCRALEKRKFGR